MPSQLLITTVATFQFFFRALFNRQPRSLGSVLSASANCTAKREQLLRVQLSRPRTIDVSAKNLTCATLVTSTHTSTTYRHTVPLRTCFAKGGRAP
jgi:hypothetical protein